MGSRVLFVSCCMCFSYNSYFVGDCRALLSVGGLGQPELGLSTVLCTAQMGVSGRLTWLRVVLFGDASVCCASKWMTTAIRVGLSSASLWRRRSLT